MHWNKIPAGQALEAVIEESAQKPVLLFKHSHRCSISAVALSRLERSWDISDEQLIPYIIDVVNERPMSNLIAQEFGIWHESPQALVIKDGKCVYHASHMGISYKDIAEAISIES